MKRMMVSGALVLLAACGGGKDNGHTSQPGMTAMGNARVKWTRDGATVNCDNVFTWTTTIKPADSTDSGFSDIKVSECDSAPWDSTVLTTTVGLNQITVSAENGAGDTVAKKSVSVNVDENNIAMATIAFTSADF